MVFNSLTFLVFFAVVMALHHCPLPWAWRKLNLLLASYVFYAAWSPPLTLLLIGATLVSFVFGRALLRCRGTAAAKWIMALGVLVHLGILAYYKYANLLIDTLMRIANALGAPYQATRFDIILPLGISFFTFEAVSYLVDIYRQRSDPAKSIVDYALFLTFFPHLVAGPIVRAHDFLPQCEQPRPANGKQISWGLVLLILGLFEKVVLADAVFAPIADTVFNARCRLSGLDAWAGVFAFSGQIYFDFAGYSTCGIGAALCLGFVLNENFHCPYAAVGFSDFWRRWHISLSSWLRDYLYIPLGGSRNTQTRTCVNLMITMLLGGLWHGAAWRFVGWGGIHGGYLVVERLVSQQTGRWRFLESWPIQMAGAALTFVLVSVTWVFFRAESWDRSCEMLSNLLQPVTHTSVVSVRQLKVIVLATVSMVVCQWWLRNRNWTQVLKQVPWWGSATVVAAMLLCLIFAPGDDRAFIYFQF